jgi:nitronate monooxygenase
VTLFDVDSPIIAAPMAGGPTIPSLLLAAAQAGALGFLAGGYKTPAALESEIAEVRAALIPFGVNLFAPSPVPVDPAAFDDYRDALRSAASRFDVDLGGGPPRNDDDEFGAKVALLLEDPVPVASFTFGIPPVDTIRRLQRAGTVVVQTVTSVAEAQAAVGAGVDVLAVQSAAAGGHWGTLTPDRPPSPLPLIDLLSAVRDEASLPLVAAGGIGTPADVASALQAGASAVMVGTALLRAPESGTSAPYRAALSGDRDTVVTRAFSGRPARGLRNTFIDQFDAVAPLGYPAVHHLTSPLRKASTAAGDPEWTNLWAGTGYRHGSEDPAATILSGLTARL